MIIDTRPISELLPDVDIKRWESATGQKAELISSGAG
jgi:hypothetical protein